MKKLMIVLRACAMLSVGIWCGGAQSILLMAQTAEAIQVVDQSTLENLTALKMNKLSDEEAAQIYATRMSSPGPGNLWVPIVDADILGRPAAAAIFHRLLADPPHKRIRLNLWAWLEDHPNFPATDSLLKESLELYQKTKTTWRWQERVGFAYLLAAVGGEEVEPILNELAATGDLQVGMARKRYWKRMNKVEGPTTKTVETPQPEEVSQPQTDDNKPEPASASQPQRQDGTTSWIASIITAVVVLGVAFWWWLFKRRAS